MSDETTLIPKVTAWHQLTTSDLECWSDLVRKCNAAPDLQPEWSAALIEAHGIPRNEVYVLRLFGDDGLHLLWPLWIRTQRRAGLPVTVVEPVTSTYALRQAVLSDMDPERTVHHLLNVLDSTFSGWTQLKLRQLSNHEAITAAWRQVATERGLIVREEMGKKPPFMVMSGTWEHYLQSRSANFRANLKRKTKRLANHAPYHVRFASGATDVRMALLDIAAIEAHSWKQELGTSMVARPWEERFYQRLAEGLGAKGQLMATLLEIQGRPVAYDLTIIGGGRGYCLKTSFDARHADLSPGIVLRAALIECLFRQGINEYDFLGDSERYKLEWATGVRTEIAITLTNRHTVLGQIIGLAENAIDFWSSRSERDSRSGRQ